MEVSEAVPDWGRVGFLVLSRRWSWTTTGSRNESWLCRELHSHLCKCTRAQCWARRRHGGISRSFSLPWTPKGAPWDTPPTLARVLRRHRTSRMWNWLVWQVSRAAVSKADPQVASYTTQGMAAWRPRQSWCFCSDLKAEKQMSLLKGSRQEELPLTHERVTLCVLSGPSTD